MQGKGVRPYRTRTRIEAMSFFAVDPIEDPIRASLKKVERI
jgi:hypothetical protein